MGLMVRRRARAQRRALARRVPFGAGLDGRLFTDLSKLGPTKPVTPSDAFYIRTRYPDLLPESPWRIYYLREVAIEEI
jgi:hypothetical protein